MSTTFDFTKQYCYRNGDTVEELLQTQHHIFPIVSQEGSGILHSHTSNGADAASADFDLVVMFLCTELKENELVVVWDKGGNKFIKPFVKYQHEKIVTRDLGSNNKRLWEFGIPFKDYDLENDFPVQNNNKNYWNSIKIYTPVMVWLEGGHPVVRLFHSFLNDRDLIVTKDYQKHVFEEWHFGETVQDFDFTNPDWD